MKGGAFLLLLSLGATWSEACQPDMHLAGELRSRHTVDAFSGDAIILAFHLIHPAAEEVELAADLFQVGGTLAVPLLKNLSPASTAPGKVVTEADFAFDLPDVERTTSFFFRLKVRIGRANWEKAGEAAIVVYPDLDWKMLQDRAEALTLWTKAAGPITRFLRNVGWEIHSPGSLAMRDQKGLVIWEASETDDDLPDQTAPGQNILIVQPRKAGESFSRIDWRQTGSGAICIISLQCTEKIGTDPSAQITLFQAIKSLTGDREHTVQGEYLIPKTRPSACTLLVSRNANRTR